MVRRQSGDDVLKLTLPRKLPFTTGCDPSFTFDRMVSKQKQHLDLCYKLVQQAFSIRFPDGSFFKEPIAPSIANPKTSRVQLKPASFPSMNEMEKMFDKRVDLAACIC